jgi:hypothetical protein
VAAGSAAKFLSIDAGKAIRFILSFALDQLLLSSVLEIKSLATYSSPNQEHDSSVTEFPMRQCPGFCQDAPFFKFRHSTMLNNLGWPDGTEGHWNETVKSTIYKNESSKHWPPSDCVFLTQTVTYSSFRRFHAYGHAP